MNLIDMNIVMNENEYKCTCTQLKMERTEKTAKN